MLKEAVAEGGITRFMGIFYCGAAADEVKIAPVRSARIYFVNLAAGFGDKPIFMHVGGANDYSGFGDTVREARALEELETMGWRTPKGNDFDTTYDSAFPVFWRNYERLGRQVATEHTMVASLDKAYEQAASRDLNYKDSDGVAWDKKFKPYLFEKDSPLSDPVATEISFEFWSNKGDYDVTWKYDREKNSYLRYNGGRAHTDLENEEQLSAKNVVVVFAKERGPVDRNKHMLYDVMGKGSALVFQDGDVIKASWSKQAETDMMRFSKEDAADYIGILTKLDRAINLLVAFDSKEVKAAMGGRRFTPAECKEVILRMKLRPDSDVKAIFDDLRAFHAGDEDSDAESDLAEAALSSPTARDFLADLMPSSPRTRRTKQVKPVPGKKKLRRKGFNTDG